MTTDIDVIAVDHRDGLAGVVLKDINTALGPDTWPDHVVARMVAEL